MSNTIKFKLYFFIQKKKTYFRGILVVMKQKKINKCGNTFYHNCYSLP